MRKGGTDSAESVLRDLDEQHHKYKFMEVNLLARKKRQVSYLKLCLYRYHSAYNLQGSKVMSPFFTSLHRPILS